MKQYIGTKLVEAERVLRINGEMKPTTYPIPDGTTIEVKIEHGYKVRYADGYESFSPKEVFEKAYLPLEINRELKTDKPSISEKMVDDFIKRIYVATLGNKTTMVRAVLANGFEIVESSACVEAENYDVRMGTEICLDKIRDRIWYLLGFLLQTAVHGIDGVEVFSCEAEAAAEIPAKLPGRTGEVCKPQCKGCCHGCGEEHTEQP